jgi:hypothetical protein
MKEVYFFYLYVAVGDYFFAHRLRRDFLFFNVKTGKYRIGEFLPLARWASGRTSLYICDSNAVS